MQFTQDASQFHNKVRVRVCGLLIRDGKILLLKHMGIGNAGYLWSPPGGGVQYGEESGSALIREFKEEVNLAVTLGDFLFVNEYLDKKHHAIELFYQVHNLKDVPTLGHDPELSDENQIISDLRFFDIEGLNQILPTHKHNVLHQCDQINQLLVLNGFHFFNNI